MPAKKQDAPQPEEGAEVSTEQQAEVPDQQAEQQQEESNEVEVPFGENPSETATLLLAAAEEAGEEPGVVRTIGGAFLVPREIAEKAGVGDQSSND